MSIFVAMLCISSVAYAQVCRPTDGTPASPQANVACDMTYYNAIISCDKSGGSATFGTRPACPAKPMPMIDTPQASFIRDYSPYLYAFARDPDNKTQPYVGPLYRGTPGDTFNSMFGGGVDKNLTGADTSTKKSLAACVPQIQPTDIPGDAAEEAKLVRYQLDNCVNQYILRASSYPLQKENSRQYSMEDASDPTKKTSLATECQPLRTFTETENEYSPSDYMQAAWIKLLQDPNYKKAQSGSVLQGLNSIPPIIIEIVTNLGSISNLGNIASNAITGGINSIQNMATNAINNTVNRIQTTVTNLASSLSNMVTGMVNRIQSTITNVATQIANIPGQLEALAARVQGIDGQKLMQMADEATGVSQKIESISNMATSLETGATNLANQASNVGETASNLASGANIDSISTRFGEMGDAAGVALTTTVDRAGAQIVRGVTSGSIGSGVTGEQLLAPVTSITGGSSGGGGFFGSAMNSITRSSNISGRIDTLTARAGGLQTGLNGLTSNASAMERQLTSLNGSSASLSRMQSDLTRMANVAGPFQAEYSRLAGQITGIQSGINGLTGQATSLQTQLQNQATEMLNGALGFDPGSLLGGSIPSLHPTHEPQPPSGLDLKEPIPPQQPFPNITLSSIAAIPYEEINDPSHPFSPRWDFGINDREFSPLTKGYMSDTKNAVYCAGVRDASSAGAGGPGTKSQEDLEIPVDVLEFRRKKFSEGLLNRIGYNTICRNAPNLFEEEAPLPAVMAGSYCYIITRVDMTGIWAISLPCWECFGLDGDLAADESPPCSTHYDGDDLPIVGGLPGALNNFSFEATCNGIPAAPRNSEWDIDKICRDLRKPYTNLNKLKMRYHNPDDEEDPEKQNVTLKNGVPEGLSFKEYFGNHMPYPRMWDTGSSLQKFPNSDGNDQPPTDTTGQYTVIVGVGRESASGSDERTLTLHSDQRCLYGGWGGAKGSSVNVSGVGSIKLPDPITSWTELKLYQANTLRQANISCIGRYEKVFKTGSTENTMLLSAGGQFPQVLVTKCPRSGPDTSNCDYMTLKEYQDAGSPHSDTTNSYTVQTVSQGVPLSWRGYLSSTRDEDRFPNFGGSGSTESGLDNAQMGDIVIFEHDSSNNKGLPKLGLVIGVNNSSGCESRKGTDADGRTVTAQGCYVEVLEADNGKFPDSCGTTDAFGKTKSRKLYKRLDGPSKAELDRIGATSSCEDTKLIACELRNWSSIKLYRPRSSARTGCDRATAGECPPDEGG